MSWVKTSVLSMRSLIRESSLASSSPWYLSRAFRMSFSRVSLYEALSGRKKIELKIEWDLVFVDKFVGSINFKCLQTSEIYWPCDASKHHATTKTVAGHFTCSWPAAKWVRLHTNSQNLRQVCTVTGCENLGTTIYKDVLDFWYLSSRWKDTLTLVRSYWSS